MQVDTERDQSLIVARIDSFVVSWKIIHIVLCFLKSLVCVPFFFFNKHGLTVSLGWPSTPYVEQAGHGPPEISGLCLPNAGWCSCTNTPGTLLFDNFCVVLCTYIRRSEVRVRSLTLRDHSPLYFLRQNLSLTLEITGLVWLPWILLSLPSQYCDVQAFATTLAFYRESGGQTQSACAGR